MKVRFFGVAVVISLLSVSGQSQGETLQEAVKYVIETNPQIRTVVYNRLARDQEVKQARAGYFPELGLTAGAGFREIEAPVEDSLNPWEFTLSLRQNIFRGLQDINEVNRQKARVRSEAYTIQTIAEDNALETARAYLQVMRKQEFVDLAEENLSIHKRIYDQIRLRSESGVGKSADMYQVQSRLALAESNVIVTKTNLVDAETNYHRIVGHMPENLDKPEELTSVLPTSFEEIQESAIEGDPTLKSAEEDLQARHQQDKVAKAPYWPIVDIELDKGWSEDLDYGLNTDRENLIGMLRVRYNFFRGWKDRARKVETTQLVSEAREIRNNTYRQVVERSRLSWMAYQSTLARIQYLEDRVESTTLTAQAYSKQWNIRQRTLLDVLDAEAERIEATQDLLDTKYEGIFSQFRMVNNIGGLVHALDLEYPEEAYIEEETKPETSMHHAHYQSKKTSSLIAQTPAKQEQYEAHKARLDIEFEGVFGEYRKMYDSNQLSQAIGFEWPDETNVVTIHPVQIHQGTLSKYK